MYVLTIGITNDADPLLPLTAEIRFEMPGAATPRDARTVAKAIRAGYRDAYGVKVQASRLQRVEHSTDMNIDDP